MEVSITAAQVTFSTARKITKAVGIVKRTLRIFDELAKADTKGTLVEVRLFAAGKK